MRILLSNDDGVHAPGIKVLRQVLSEIADVYVVAPLEEKSATGHGLTLSHPVRVVQIEEKVWGVSGYPADCILMALQELLADVQFDVVISGINHGANMGQEVYYSGTAAAAREAAFNSLKSIAVSLVTDPPHQKPLYFETAAHFVKEFIKKKGHERVGPNQMFNINVPNLPRSEIKGVEATRLGFRLYTKGMEKRLDTRQKPYYWLGGQFAGPERIPGSDGLAVLEKKISVSLLDLLPHSSVQQEELISFVNTQFAVKL